MPRRSNWTDCPSCGPHEVRQTFDGACLCGCHPTVNLSEPEPEWNQEETE